MPVASRRTFATLGATRVGHCKAVLVWQPATWADIEGLIGRARESSALDLKRELPTQGRSFPKQIAAMARAGGVILYGVEEDKVRRVASAITPVPVDGAEERIRASTNDVEPRLAFEVEVLRSTPDAERGVVAVIVPPSPSWPHMVDGRYPVREGTTTRYLSDSETREAMTQGVMSRVESVFSGDERSEPDRGWAVQYAATFGFAALIPDATENALLVEFPYGAHSAVFLVLRDALFGSHRERIELEGVLMNGTGARFHVRESSDGRTQEVVTLDYVQPLLEGRAFAEMPTQAVYYRLERGGFVEVGRGDVYDPVEAPWDIPRAIEPFLDPDWIREQREA